MCSEGGARGSWTSQEAFQRINSLLDQLAGENLNSAPAESMGDDQVALHRIGNRVQAEGLRRLRRFDSGQGYAPSGALSARAWLRWQLNLTATTASERVTISRKMVALPQTEQALADGNISYRHATLTAEAAGQLGDKFEAQAETILVEAAAELDPWRLQRAIWHLKHCLDSDGVLSDANKSNSRRFLHLSQTFDGVYRIDGWLDAVGGATLNTALNSVMGPRLADDDRSAAERRADAAVDMARRQLDGGQLPEVGGQKPHLMVTLDVSTLTKEPGSRAAELEWASPIPAETARRLACDCTITPILCGAESHQVEVASSSRVIPPAMKRALIARDKHCRFPGCDMPPAWTDGHHIKHWANGGPHALWNLLLFWGLLPNSRQQTTIGVPSFLTCVSAGGAALDGVQSGRAEALPQLLARRSRPRKAHRSTPGRGCRFRIRTQLGQQALQPHRPTIGRPGGPVQALAARLPLQHS